LVEIAHVADGSDSACIRVDVDDAQRGVSISRHEGVARGAHRPEIAERVGRDEGRSDAVEHRLFSFISIHWRGRLLRTYETVVNRIGNTTNRGGLVVRAQLDERRYPIGKRVSDMEMRSLKIEPDAFHGDWNDTVRPRNPSA
jgi:hypothetical protein